VEWQAEIMEGVTQKEHRTGRRLARWRYYW